MRDLQPLCVRTVRAALTQYYSSYCDRLRQVQQGQGSRTGFYFREVGNHLAGKLPQYLRKWLRRIQVQHCLLFRLGCHHLHVHTGRRADLPRPQRLCQRCSIRAVDDEYHCIHRCQYRPLAAARAQLQATVQCGEFPKIHQLFELGSRGAATLRRVVRFMSDYYYYYLHSSPARPGQHSRGATTTVWRPAQQLQWLIR
jgi:hypothetical protein